MELSKKERKTAREIIEAGLQKEFARVVYEADAIVCEWKSKKTGNREAYYSLYKQLTDFDKHIAGRYDDMRASQYLFIIAAQLRDGIISVNDLENLSPEIKQAVIFLAGK